MIEGRLSINDREREEAFYTLGSLGSGVWQAWGPSTATEVKDLCIVVRHVCDFAIVVENYIQGRWSPRTFTVIIDQRNFVQHSLMSLKSKREVLDDGATIGESLYEPCRLAVIAFSFLVVFPLPPVVGPFESLSDQLLAELTTINMDDESVSQPRLLLWILVMGAIAAIGLPEREWFIRRIHDLSVKMGIVNFEEMKGVLQTFLWLPSANDPDGQDLWTEIPPETVSST
jgi:hypothetical protein